MSKSSLVNKQFGTVTLNKALLSVNSDVLNLNYEPVTGNLGIPQIINVSETNSANVDAVIIGLTGTNTGTFTLNFPESPLDGQLIFFLNNNFSISTFNLTGTYTGIETEYIGYGSIYIYSAVLNTWCLVAYN